MVHVDGFDGPLDLLLDLAERQRLDLGRISVPQVERLHWRRVLPGSLFSVALELAREGALVLEQDDVAPALRAAPERSGRA